MKNLVRSLLILTTVLLTSCIGEQGPPGVDGDSFLGQIFEIQGDFKSQNNYELLYEFPSDFKVYDSDIVMVYLLWEEVNQSGGETLDVWRALPQTIVLNEGVLQYNFDYTVADVKIFLDGTIDFSKLLPAEKDNQVFRIAVLPAAFATDNYIDLNNMNSIMNMIDLNVNSVDRIK